MYIVPIRYAVCMYVYDMWLTSGANRAKRVHLNHVPAIPQHMHNTTHTTHACITHACKPNTHARHQTQHKHAYQPQHTQHRNTHTHTHTYLHFSVISIPSPRPVCCCWLVVLLRIAVCWLGCVSRALWCCGCIYVLRQHVFVPECLV